VVCEEPLAAGEVLASPAPLSAVVASAADPLALSAEDLESPVALELASGPDAPASSALGSGPSSSASCEEVSACPVTPLVAAPSAADALAFSAEKFPAALVPDMGPPVKRPRTGSSDVCRSLEELRARGPLDFASASSARESELAVSGSESEVDAEESALCEAIFGDAPLDAPRVVRLPDRTSRPGPPRFQWSLEDFADVEAPLASRVREPLRADFVAGIAAEEAAANEVVFS